MPGQHLVVVDAFTDQPFRGNPAAVTILEGERDDAWLQAVAAEMNLSETAFLRRIDRGHWDLRWFTPVREVPLCGHATLASAHVLREGGHDDSAELRFRTLAGELRAEVRDGRTWLDFPTVNPVPAREPDGLRAALGLAGAPLGLASSGGVSGSIPNLLVELADAGEVEALTPDFGAVGRLPWGGVVVTAAGGGVDFASRYFAPAFGIDEDPVTGSTHCLLAPYWAERTGRTSFAARQLSARGGELWVEMRGNRTLIGGHAVTVSRVELIAAPG
ncbi:MAG TPA: PhzF family phenazine biosynthesis isomerase [Thermomicrobiales bacterium]|jgi:PhzF family phenazine biosynthesis protein|nr:PhzF family phenazine biosynthesis isomerase [Thermomicrobiales bacterium]